MKYLLVLCILLSYCKPALPTMEEKRAEVMKVHDDAMAKMGDLRNSAIALEELIPQSADSIVVKKLIRSLENSEEGMMLWMEQYKEPEENLAAFYQSEMVKIQKVANEINKSLADAEKIINK